MKEIIHNSSEQNQPRIIYVKAEVFPHIESGEKTLELRIGFGSFSKIKAGDVLDFKGGAGKSIKANVKDMREYKTLKEVLEKEDVNKILPGATKEEISEVSQKFFKQSDIDQYGLVVLEFEKI